MTDVSTARPRNVRRSLAPLVIVAVAVALWLVSDRLLYIGPLDRATFGWTVVIPIWAAAPLAAGSAWRVFERQSRLIAAAMCGLLIAILVAALAWQAVVFPSCPTGPSRGPIEWLPPAIVLGSLIGGGFAVNCLVAAAQVRVGHPWRALALGAIGQLAIVLLASIAAFTLFFGVCRRP